jgi:hypothetical protein
MIYGPWLIVVSKCILGLCMRPDIDLEKHTFTSQETCEIAGTLIKDVGDTRTIWPAYYEYSCINWVDELKRQQAEEELNRPKAPKPAPPATL